jgi:beta-catenin-like protein 1
MHPGRVHTGRIRILVWLRIISDLQEAEQLAEDLKELENIDERGIRRIVAGIERRIRKNQEHRMKYSDDPQRFLQSELELNELLSKLSALAGEPELYTQLVEQQCVPMMLELLQHENIDIVTSVVELLKDLTDADSVEDLDEVQLQHGRTATDIQQICS